MYYGSAANYSVGGSFFSLKIYIMDINTDIYIYI